MRPQSVAVDHNESQGQNEHHHQTIGECISSARGLQVRDKHPADRCTLRAMNKGTGSRGCELQKSSPTLLSVCVCACTRPGGAKAAMRPWFVILGRPTVPQACFFFLTIIIIFH